ncbi:MAG: HAD hydrolase-like protein [Desulfobacteraceae bacterium]
MNVCPHCQAKTNPLRLLLMTRRHKLTPMNNSLLLFDLDGTISDPLEGIARSFNYALSFYGHDEVPISDLSQYIGPPLDECFKMITGIDEHIEINNFISKYRERYSDVGFSENKLYPGIRESITALSSQNVAMAICTSKRRDFAERILRLFGIRHHFRFVSGGDSGIQKWQQIESLMDSGAIDDSCTMIGDRAVDLSAAHKNGIKSAGVLWGFGSRAELEAQSPICLLSQPSDLLILK